MAAAEMKITVRDMRGNLQSDFRRVLQVVAGNDVPSDNPRVDRKPGRFTGILGLCQLDQSTFLVCDAAFLYTIKQTADGKCNLSNGSFACRVGSRGQERLRRA
jgi:hypothetical protein